jgi:hypothetical protein
MIVGAFKYIMRHEEEFAHWVMVFGRRGGLVWLLAPYGLVGLVLHGV